MINLLEGIESPDITLMGVEIVKLNNLLKNKVCVVDTVAIPNELFVSFLTIGSVDSKYIYEILDVLNEYEFRNSEHIFDVFQMNLTL